MLFHLCKKIQKGITTGLILSLFVGLFAFAPITPDGKVPKAEALLRGGSGCTGCLPVLKSQLAQDLLNTGSNAITAGIQQSLFIKEWTMDGVFNGLAKLMIKSMTISIVNWINSGFQGKPAFLQDLKQYVLDRADKIAGDFIYNDPSLSFLCSPFQLDVKIALATSYQQEAHGGFDSQCTLSEVTENVEGFLSGSFSEGGWQSWFEVTQNPVNTPTGAFLAAEAEMYARIVDDQGRAIKELDWGEGFLSFKVCADTENQKGCDITTPGTVIANQINKSLGAGQDALIEADEVNEVIGALLGQLAQKAITGLGGLFGLSDSSYSYDSSTGDFSTTSPGTTYLDQLEDESTFAEGIDDPFEPVIQRLSNRSGLLLNTINEIDEIEQELILLKARKWPDVDCPMIEELEMPETLIDLRENSNTDRLQHIADRATLSGKQTIYLQSRTDRNAQKELKDAVEELNYLRGIDRLISEQAEKDYKNNHKPEDDAEIAAFAGAVKTAEVECIAFEIDNIREEEEGSPSR